MKQTYKIISTLSTESKTQITPSPRQTNAEFESFDDDYRVRCEPNVAKHTRVNNLHLLSVCRAYVTLFFDHLSTFTGETGILFGY